ncbi:hypothetical protein TKK_0018298 [Trichogramma kaykai]
MDLNRNLLNLISSFYECNGLFNATLSYMRSLENEHNVKSNFIQSKLWKEQIKNFNRDGVVLPLFGYFDDVETGNGIGSHAGQNAIGTVYARIPCYPPNFSAKLESILVTDLSYTSDRKIHGNRKTFKKFIDEISDLFENGLEIVVKNSPTRVYFITGLMLGHNLGINSIFSFVQSFASTPCCRTCSASAEDIKKMTEEDPKLLRTLEQYTRDTKQKNKSITGIVEDSIFHSIKEFHVISNQTTDIMHEFYLGVCNDVITNLLLQYLCEDGFFDINFFNYNIKSIHFYHESNNLPPQLSLDHMKKIRK